MIHLCLYMFIFMFMVGIRNDRISISIQFGSAVSALETHSTVLRCRCIVNQFWLVVDDMEGACSILHMKRTVSFGSNTVLLCLF